MKIVMPLVIFFMIANNGNATQIQNKKETNLSIQLEEAYIKFGGILGFSYRYFRDVIRCKRTNYLFFKIIIDQKANISTPERNKINQVLEKAVYRKYRELPSTGCNFPDNPEILDLSNHGKLPNIPGFSNTLFKTDDERWVAEQKLTISRDNDDSKCIVIEADTVLLYREFLNGDRDQLIKVPNTYLRLSGELDIPGNRTPETKSSEAVKKQLIEENLATAARYDTLIYQFKKINEQRIDEKNEKQLLEDFYFIGMNKDIFDNNIRSLLKPEIKLWATIMLENFTTNFLGNADMSYFSEIPTNPDIDNTKRDIVPSVRQQDPNINSTENYSMYSISASKKTGLILDRHKIKLPDFRHMLTIRDSLLHEALITYPSNKYEDKIETPLKSDSLFGTQLGQKISDDIFRFFYGFTTALTIQDTLWLKRYYHDLATRSFFPGKSNHKESFRVVARGAEDILKRYKTLWDRGREIYVTLNADGESKIEDSEISVWVALKHKKNRVFESLTDIKEDPTLSKMMQEEPAYLLSLEMLQKWVTIDRFTQIPRLEDDAIVEFTLLFLNINRLNDWLESNKFDQLTAITIGSYLYDLGTDMYQNEREDSLAVYKELYAYMKKNAQTMEEIQNEKSDKKKRKKYKNVFGSKKRFNRIRRELPKFINSSLRVNVHNRRFLFNVCYLKIIYQYTYDNDKGPVQKPMPEFIWIAKEFQDQIKKRKN